ncbi:MAG: hypothetical protein ACK4R6_04790 [Spirosomataceae bacterium]
MERSFAWRSAAQNKHYRRLSKDFERLTNVAENFIKLAFVRIASKKLTN